MKLPRDVSGDRLIHVLKRLGYDVIREKGSHARLRNNGPPPHIVTIPLHKNVKTGTLHTILSEVARARTISIEALIEML